MIVLLILIFILEIVLFLVGISAWNSLTWRVNDYYNELKGKDTELNSKIDMLAKHMKLKFFHDKLWRSTKLVERCDKCGK